MKREIQKYYTSYVSLFTITFRYSIGNNCDPSLKPSTADGRVVGKIIPNNIINSIYILTLFVSKFVITLLDLS